MNGELGWQIYSYWIAQDWPHFNMFVLTPADTSCPSLFTALPLFISWTFLSYPKHTPAPGHMHWLLLPAMLHLHVSSGLTIPWLLSGLSLNAILPEVPASQSPYVAETLPYRFTSMPQFIIFLSLF